MSEIEKIKLAQQSLNGVILDLNLPSTPNWQKFVDTFFDGIAAKTIDVVHSQSKYHQRTGTVEIMRKTGIIYSRGVYDSIIQARIFKSLCDSLFNSEGNVDTIMSLVDATTDDHFDITDSVYWHCHGKNTWIVNGKEFKLEPGDVLYFPKDSIHSVISGPLRAGLIWVANE